MGQKVFKNNSEMTFERFYPTHEVYESWLSGSSLKKSTNMLRHTLNSFCAGSFECGLSQDITGQSACEFQDYCNHLYFIDDKCDCTCTWQKTTGLVIPTSI
jgi:hypothetical protein